MGLEGKTTLLKSSQEVCAQVLPTSTLLPLFFKKNISSEHRFSVVGSYCYTATQSKKKSVFAGRRLNIRMAIYNPHGISMFHQGEHIDKEQCWLRWGSLCMETASPCNRPHCRLQIPRMHRPMGTHAQTHRHTDTHTHTQLVLYEESMSVGFCYTASLLDSFKFHGCLIAKTITENPPGHKPRSQTFRYFRLGHRQSQLDSAKH